MVVIRKQAIDFTSMRGQDRCYCDLTTVPRYAVIDVSRHNLRFQLEQREGTLKYMPNNNLQMPISGEKDDE